MTITFKIETEEQLNQYNDFKKNGVSFTNSEAGIGSEITITDNGGSPNFYNIKVFPEFIQELISNKYIKELLSQD